MVVAGGVATGVGEVVEVNHEAGVQVYDAAPDATKPVDAPLQIVVSYLAMRAERKLVSTLTNTLNVSRPHGPTPITV